jgi:hypothetical protein
MWALLLEASLSRDPCICRPAGVRRWNARSGGKASTCVGFNPLESGCRQEATMQFMLIVMAVAAVMLFDLRATQADEGPWCAVGSIDFAVSENCSMRTFEMCVQQVIAGNRGFCNPNPRWQGNRGPEARQRRGQRKRYKY